jgi:D-arabinose 1-dehydrogenase-like Zn-dependent alcohol dehydrogenase
MRPSYGFNVDGGYAESCRVAAERLVPLRDVPFDFGATLGCAGITAYHAVKSIANVELADTVAIYGTGGVGMYALQIAKLGGAKVIAIGRSQDKLDMAQRLGADYVVNASSSKIRDEVKKITSGKGPDIVLDFVVSDESMKNSASFLANGGKVVLVGVSNKPISFNPQIFVLKEFTIAGSLVGNKNELAELVGLAESGRLKSVVTKKFSLDEINGAIDNLRNGQILGRGYFAIS